MGAQKEAEYAKIWYIDKKKWKKMNQILHKDLILIQPTMVEF